MGHECIGSVNERKPEKGLKITPNFFLLRIREEARIVLAGSRCRKR